MDIDKYQLWMVLIEIERKMGRLVWKGNIYILFGPVKPELGVIPSGQENHSGAHLNFPGGELNVIFLQSYIS